LESSPKNSVLIVDDSVVVRKVLKDIISRDKDLEVAGFASNGRLALARLQNLRPDVILLDIEMPEMDGLEAIPEIRKILPQVPIIMFSTLTQRGAEATLDALTLGATDYVTKPSNMDIDFTPENIAQQLIPKIKALCQKKHVNPVLATSPAAALAKAPSLPLSPQVRSPLIAPVGSRVEIVAIGVSTGGPEALAKFLPTFPAGFPVPIVIAQHMPPLFTSLLAERLASKCSMDVREAKSGELLEPGLIWIAPGDYHLAVSQEGGVVRLRTHQESRENFCRPSVDVLFRSVAEVFGSRALGVVLTGMGQDGLKGCEMLHAGGSHIIVQDEATSVVWGMPGFVARAGLADKILHLDQIGPEIVHRVLNQTHSLQVH
jgi:two-component system chemotaxis response regulator CheB